MPNQFAIILDPGYFEHERIYDSVIPNDALILTISDATFGSSGLANSEAETVSLIDLHGNFVSSYTYTIDNNPHYSDEKIICQALFQVKVNRMTQKVSKGFDKGAGYNPQ